MILLKHTNIEVEIVYCRLIELLYVFLPVVKLFIQKSSEEYSLVRSHMKQVW
jgi:hypothetical protein